MRSPMMSAKTQGAKLRLEIYDTIGPSWAGMVDTKSVAAALRAAGSVSEISVHINSPGGSAFEGLGIFNVLREHPAKINVVVDGVAASSASLIAMAGDTITVANNALMMIHEPWSVVTGEIKDLEKAITALGKVRDAAITTYAARSRQSPQWVADKMAATTWFSATEAVAAGFADAIGGAAKVSPTVKNEVMSMFADPTSFAAAMSLPQGSAGDDQERRYKNDPANAQFIAEYQAQAAHYAKAGISLSDYVFSRRVDMGLETLATRNG